MSMYVPRHFAPGDRAAVVCLMHDHPFATLITAQGPDPLVTQLPLLHVADCEPHGTLYGHFARANLHAAALPGADSIAVFQGPHAYVSPSWYAVPAAAVPTWNYAVVHAHGTIYLADDPVDTRAIVDALVKRFEASRAQPWTLGLAPDALHAMVGAIVGFCIRIKRLEAKFKLSQNRSAGDQRRVAEALAAGDAEAAATANWMRTYGSTNHGEE